MLDVMLDTETMGLVPGVPCLAIGAVEFDLNKLQLGERFYITADLESCVGYGLRMMDPGTMKWWMRQSEKAQSAIARPQTDIRSALLMFRDFLERCGETNEIRVWGNDPAFDNGIVQASYSACGLEVPWKFWNNRCLRTFRGMWPSIAPDERQGVHHNALDDAIFQAEHMLKIRRVLNERRAS